MAQGGNGGGPAKGVNKILGNWKDNILIGTDGVDVISGRGGDDTLIGGLDGDTLDGGEGNDTASYAGSLAGVTVSSGALSSETSMIFLPELKRLGTSRYSKRSPSGCQTGSIPP